MYVFFSALYIRDSGAGICPDSDNNKWVKKVSGSFNSHLSDTYNFTNVEATQLDLGNNQRARFGGSQELQIYNDCFDLNCR